MRQLGHNRDGDTLEKHKDYFKQFLIENKWTIADMTGHQWVKNKFGSTYYGLLTDNLLRNTNGVRISPSGFVIMGNFDNRGHVTKPYIICEHFDFRILR